MDKRKGKRIVLQRLSTESVDEERQVDRDLSPDELFDVFIAAKQAEGRADRTILDHRKNYRYFRQWLDKMYPGINPRDLDATVFREWITYLQNEKVAYEGHPTSPQQYVGLAPGTINIRLRSLKCMFKFLHDEGYLETNPTARVKLVRVEDDGVQTFTIQQVKLLLAAPDKRTYAGFRDYVLMLMLLDTGMRINEALKLRHDDVDLKTLSISIAAKISKTRKARHVPISKKTARELARLIAEVKLNFDNIDNVFVSNYGEKYYDNYFRTRLKMYAEKAHIRGVRVSPHTFRHTFAKMFILNGGDPFTLQRILGHSDISMSKRYVTMFADDVKAVHRRATPLESLKF